MSNKLTVHAPLTKSDGTTLLAAISASFNTQWIECKEYQIIAAGFTFTSSTPIGELVIEVANTKLSPSDSDAVSVPGTSKNPAGGSPIFLNVSELGARWWRVKYTHTSGSWTITDASYSMKVE